MLDETTFAAAVDELCAADPDLAAIVERHGLPPFWAREPGLGTLVLLILEQQVSLASARAAYGRLTARLGEQGIIIRHTPEPLLNRVATGFYNTEEDIDRLAQAIRAIRDAA